MRKTKKEKKGLDLLVQKAQGKGDTMPEKHHDNHHTLITSIIAIVAVVGIVSIIFAVSNSQKEMIGKAALPYPHSTCHVSGQLTSVTEIGFPPRYIFDCFCGAPWAPLQNIQSTSFPSDGTCRKICIAHYCGLTEHDYA